jgi:hypothetical protein
MATVFCSQFGDVFGLPHRRKTMGVAYRRQATEQGVDENDAAMLVDGNIVNIYIAGDVRHLRHIETIETVALLARRQHVVELPELVERTQIH